MALSNKQRIFVDCYLKTWNATEAARLAGYKGNDVTLASVGYENLRKPQIAGCIEQRLKESAMSADEVLALLAEQARGNMADFLEFKEGVNIPYLNMEQARDRGKLGIVKKFKYNTEGLPEIELYDAQSALALLGKHHGLFVERVEHTGKDGLPIPIALVRKDLLDAL